MTVRSRLRNIRFPNHRSQALAGDNITHLFVRAQCGLRELICRNHAYKLGVLSRTIFAIRHTVQLQSLESPVARRRRCAA
jgi:hypothetical protein